jgi:hypothetical protein
MNLLINKCVTAVILSNFAGHYLRNRSTLDIGVLGYWVYFNIRNILPKSGRFLLGHPVYNYDVDLLKMSRVMLETCRGF